MTVTDVRPLAGVRFEDVPSVSPRVLPRMDVVGLVGYASSGPVHTAVAVESVEEFRRVFGGAVDLGWDEARRRPVTSQLGAAVRDFFVNGGKRAWVVRAASRTISSAVAPLPGVLSSGDGDGLAPARLVAASPGAAGGLAEMACAAVTDPITLVRPGPRRTLVVQVEAGLVVGDLVRATWAEHVAYVRVVQVTAPERATRAARTPVDGLPVVEQQVLLSDPLVALRRAARLLVRAGPGDVEDVSGVPRTVHARLEVDDVSQGWSHGLPVTLVVSNPGARPRPAVGGWLKLPAWVGEEESPTDAWVSVDEAVPSETEDDSCVVHGRVCLPHERWVGPVPAEARTDRVTLEVHAQHGGGRSVLTGVGLLPDHPRFLGAVPDLAGRLRTDDRDPVWGSDVASLEQLPWAGSGRAALLPVLATELPTTWAAAFERSGRTLDLDGLDEPDTWAFADERLVGFGVDTLVSRADDLRWRGTVPHRPRGIHALLGIDEVTVVAVPDAAQVGWQPASGPETGAPPPSDDVEVEEGCDHGDFDDCEVVARPAAPLWLDPVERGAKRRLAWAAGDDHGGAESGLEFVVEESIDPTSWAQARVVHRGAATEVDVPSRSTLPRHYRVRAEVTVTEGVVVGRWSTGLSVAASPGLDFVAVPDGDYRPAVLLDVQRSLLRMCAARGDLLAILSVPEHYRAAQVARHVQQLTEPKNAPGPDELVTPLGPWETPVLGYGALYHPWLVHGALDADTPTSTSAPDGAVAGVVAARSRTRGAWVAPANEVLHDTIALVHDEPLADRKVLRGRQANVALRSRDEFLWLSEDTLATDPDWRPVSVRRLHSLLRRVVLLEGPHYVFEPNDPVLRRGIERGFVELMRFLFGLGAFAGAVEREAFRVSVGAVNTPASVDLGRLVVEIAYAPSRPLEFIRVRLVHAGEPGFRLVDS